MKKHLLIIFVITILLFISLFFILRNTPEYYQHNIGTSGNTVYVHESGAEAVFDVNNDIVTDDINQGSYNYYDYRKDPFRHFISDRLPWILYGNTPKDSSTRSQRIQAFIKDFQKGFSKTFSF